uniref:Uncharacterized protein n=1 Tax=Onchocerca volvulus TaxID=6282 RepID=A0A8R1TUV4_ONCVO
MNRVISKYEDADGHVGNGMECQATFQKKLRKFARAVQRVIIVDKCRLRSKQRNVLDIGNFRNGFSNKEQEDGII